MRSVRCVLWFALAAAVPAATSPARAETSKETPAAAPSIASLLEALKTEKASAPRLQKEAEAAPRQNAPLAAERRIYEQQIEARLAPIARAITADVEKLQVDVGKHNEGVHRSSQGCTGELPRPQWERCQGEKRHWDASGGRLEARKAALAQRLAAFEKQLQPYTRRLAEIEAQIERNNQAAAQAQRALAETQARIRRLEAQLADACKAQADASPEALKYCGDRSWSGAGPDLPALERPRPPFSGTPNR